MPEAPEPYELLRAFRGLFEGIPYRHRRSTLGDYVASRLYEDLLALNKSAALIERVTTGERVVNDKNVMTGKKSRRGDGTFGELVPAVRPVVVTDATVMRGPVATIEIGAEVKIMAKAMIKQIDRVVSDLLRQAKQFQAGGGNPICVAFVGVNHAKSYTSFEKKRRYPTNGKEYKHPIQEATQATRVLLAEVKPFFDEFLIFPFRATNVKPYPFEWVDRQKTLLEYSAALTRISRLYDSRFR